MFLRFRAPRACILAALTVLSTGLFAEQSVFPVTGDWPAYGADFANTQYAPLDQIDAGTVSSLEIAWVWESADVPLIEKSRKLTSFSFEATPIMVGGTLYTSTSLSQAAAIDPATGETRWVFDPESYKTGRPPNRGYVNRGVTYWIDGGGTKFRAYNKVTGAVVWQTDLPANATGTPMTYMHRGKQYIVIAVMNRGYPPSLIALSLP